MCKPRTPNSSRTDELNPGETWVADVVSDRLNLKCLELARWYMLSLSHPVNDFVTQNFEQVAHSFGNANAQTVAIALCDVVRAVHFCRRSPFIYSNPTCPDCCKVLTPQERHLILALEAARKGNRGALALHVMLLCEGFPDHQVHMTLRSLVSVLDGPDVKLRQNRPSRIERPI